MKNISKETFSTLDELDALVGPTAHGDVIAVTAKQLGLIGKLLIEADRADCREPVAPDS